MRYVFRYFTDEVMEVLIREFQTQDEEMKKIVLKVVKQTVGTEGVEADYVRAMILPEFTRQFWIRRNAMDKRNSAQLVETTVAIADKIGCSNMVSRLVEHLKDENEAFRKMVMEAIDRILTNLGATDVDPKLEEQLVDGVLYSFQEQVSEDTTVMLNGFATVINALGVRTKPYIPQIAGTIKWRLNAKSAKVRQQAADLIGRIAVVIKKCDDELMLGHLGVVLYVRAAHVLWMLCQVIDLFRYEYLGEEYPEVLGSILGGLKGIVNVIGMQKMTPPIKDLLPRLTPILRNRHEKVRS
jgi:splicing factor 3B subunit 1